MKFMQLAHRPVTVWLAVLDEVRDLKNPPFGLLGPVELDPGFASCQYRAVRLDRLPIVLAAGIDVEPRDAVIYADSFDKAWEYGGFPKAVLALRTEGLERTFTQLPGDASDEELAVARERYPTVLTSADGRFLWCSRLPHDDPRLGTPYEVAYARWIPGSPFEVLHAVMVFATVDDLPDVRKAVHAPNAESGAAGG